MYAPGGTNLTNKITHSRLDFSQLLFPDISAEVETVGTASEIYIAYQWKLYRAQWTTRDKILTANFVGLADSV